METSTLIISIILMLLISSSSGLLAYILLSNPNVAPPASTPAPPAPASTPAPPAPASTPAPPAPASTPPAPPAPAPTPAGVAAVSTFSIGQAINCNASDPQGNNTGGINGGGQAIYRYTGNNTINWYPNPSIAASYDSNWNKPQTIDCTGLTAGPNMLPNVSQNNYQSFANTDFGGQGDLIAYPGNATTCQAICDNIPDCNTFVTDNATCYFKKIGSDNKPNWVKKLTTYYKGTVVPGPAVKPYVALSGADYPGNDISSFGNATPASCQAACSNNSNCIGAMFGTDSNTCWLKSNLTGAYGNGNRVLYLPQGTGQVQGYDYGNNDITSSSSSGPADCRAKCQSQPGCIGGTFGTDVNVCWLKNKLNATGPSGKRITVV